jgi:hypothetical protein
MEAKITKKSYYLPDALTEFFKVWCKPGRDFSPKVAGAILYFMSLPPAIREKCEKLAYSEDIQAAIAQIVRSDQDGLLPLTDLLQQIQLHARVVSETPKAKKRTKRQQRSESA